jgi:hypothetical protein
LFGLSVTLELHLITKKLEAVVKYKGVRLFIAVGVLCVVRSGWGQSAQVDYLNGEIHGGSPMLLHSVVTLTDMRNRNIGWADVRADGSFSFGGVPCGEYRLTVVEDGQHALYEELISVQQHNGLLTVQLPHDGAERPPSGPVAIDQLLHPPAKKAASAFVAARKFSEAGEHEKAAEELQKAVRISPDFADAWVNLAAQHIHMGLYEQAVQELSHATEITKPTALILGDMAFAQYGLHRRDEAMKAARQALLLDSTYGPANYLLGCLLANDAQSQREALKHLEVAARTIPAAQAMLEQARNLPAQNVQHQ